jgi:hypothetical protein
MPVGTRVLYVETGMNVFTGHSTIFNAQNCQTYTRMYQGIVTESDEKKVVFQVQGYFNHYNPFLVPPKITIQEDRTEHTQSITLLRSSFECLLTDTKLVTDVFVDHLQTMDPARYWNLALETFDLSHNNLAFQHRRCRYGKKCTDIRLGHLAYWSH